MRYAYAKSNYVYKLKGYSKKITQLVNESTFPTSRTENGITFTNNNNGTFTINGTATANAILYFRDPNVIVGHKYYLKGSVKNGGGEKWYINSSPLIDYGNGAIAIANRSIGMFFIVRPNATLNNAILQPQLFDLTADFGVGHEPTTVAQCEEYYGNKYIPYGEQIVNCKMPIHAYKDGVEVAQIDCGRDLLFNDTLTTDGNVDIGTYKHTFTNADLTYIENPVSREQGTRCSTTIFRGTINAPKSQDDAYKTSNLVTSIYSATTPAEWYNALKTGFSLHRAGYGNVGDIHISFNGEKLTTKQQVLDKIIGGTMDFELATHKTSTFNPIYLKDNLTFVDDNGNVVEVVESSFVVEKYRAGLKNNNLCDINAITGGRVDNGVIGYKQDTNVLYFGNSLTFTTTSRYRGIVSDYIKVAPNTTYNLSFIGSNYTQIEVFCYTSSKTYISKVATRYDNVFNFNFKTTANCEYILFAIQNANQGTYALSNVQIEEGSTATPYVPYGTPKKHGVKLQ